MGTVIVDIYNTGNNFCAQAPVLEGCVSTASTLSDIFVTLRFTQNDNSLSSKGICFLPKSFK